MQSNLIGYLPSNEVLDTVTDATKPTSTLVHPVWKPMPILSTMTPVLASGATGTGTTQVLSSNTIGNGIPQNVLSIDVSQQATQQRAPDGHLYTIVGVSFIAVPGDANFAGVNIYFVGFHGQPTPTLVGGGIESPVSFSIESTNETVTVIVASYNGSGVVNSYESSPTTTLTLNGVTSPPNPPTLAQGATAIMAGTTQIGWQFAFNAIQGLEADTIDGYWIYRTASGTAPTPPNSRFTYMAHPSTNLGTITFPDLTAGGTQYWYWISAVNTTGLESPLVETVGNVSANAYPGSYTNNGTSGYSNPTQAYGGNESDAATATVSTSTTVSETWYGFPAVANVLEATLYVMSDASYTAGAGTYECFTHNVEIKTPDGYVPIGDLPEDEPFFIENKTGVHYAVLIVHEGERATIDIGNDPSEKRYVTLDHPMIDGGVLIPASSYYEGCPVIQYEGKVYNLHVITDDEASRHYILWNGDIAHNKPINGYYQPNDSTGSRTLSYSLNGGSSWTQISSTDNQTKQYASVSLSPSQDFTKVQVKATSTVTLDGGSFSLTSDIYEIHITYVT
jgi:hypothetical protein